MKKWFAWILAAGLLLSLMGGAVAEAPVRAVALKGPTGIGMVSMIANPGEDWTFTLAGSADEIVSALASGSVDIAAAPTNLAATLYNKTSGNVRLLALNTLGVLHILEKGESIQSVEDLNGKTLVMTGQGAMPEYVVAYIIEQMGLDVPHRQPGGVEPDDLVVHPVDPGLALLHQFGLETAVAVKRHRQLAIQPSPYHSHQ